MTTFNFKDYNDLVDPNVVNNQPSTNDENSSLTEQAENTNGLDSIQILVTGPISELVAKSLNMLFKNSQVTNYSEENNLKTISTNYIITLENISYTKPVLVYGINSSSINSNPIDYGNEFNNINKFSLENNKDVILYIDTEGIGFNSKKEEWFLTNSSSLVKKMFFTIEALQTYLINLSITHTKG